jgi:hypothetical protein
MVTIGMKIAQSKLVNGELNVFFEKGY